MSVVAVICGHRILRYADWTPKFYVQRMSDFSQFMLNPWHGSIQHAYEKEPTAVDFVLAGVQVVVQLYTHLVTYFAQLCLLICALTFQAATTQIVNQKSQMSSQAVLD